MPESGLLLRYSGRVYSLFSRSNTLRLTSIGHIQRLEPSSVTGSKASRLCAFYARTGYKSSLQQAKRRIRILNVFCLLSAAVYWRVVQNWARCPLASARYEFSAVSEEQHSHRQRYDERPRGVTRDRAHPGRARVRGDSCRSCLGHLRLSALPMDLPLQEGGDVRAHRGNEVPIREHA